MSSCGNLRSSRCAKSPGTPVLNISSRFRSYVWRRKLSTARAAIAGLSRVSITHITVGSSGSRGARSFTAGARDSLQLYTLLLYRNSLSIFALQLFRQRRPRPVAEQQPALPGVLFQLLALHHGHAQVKDAAFDRLSWALRSQRKRA